MDKFYFFVKRMFEYFLLNFEIVCLIGLWIVEGFILKNGVIKFDISFNEEDFIEFIIGMIWKYFFYVKIVVKDYERNWWIVRFCNKCFVEWFCENIGYGVDNKLILLFFFLNKNREVRLGFFRGLIEGDGYVRREF